MKKKSYIGNFKRSLYFALIFTALIWAIWLIGELFGLEFAQYGIYPRLVSSLWGVITAPLIHGSFSHIVSNSMPLLVMMTILFYIYPKSSPIVLIVLFIGSGLIVWLIGRPAWHFGASGLTHGLMFFLFFIGILRRDAIASVFAMIVFFLYGGMVWGIFPRDPNISFEYHLAGAGLGVMLAFLLRNRDRKRPAKQYSWDEDSKKHENRDSDEDIIGDQWREDKS